MDELILTGLRMLAVNDGYLLENDLSERTITHKLGQYYSYTFANYDVDCEYNKNLNGPKNITIDPGLLLMKMADFLDQNGGSGIEADYSFMRNAHVEPAEVEFLKEQLRDSNNLVYDEELDLVAFVLRLTEGKRVVKAIFPDIIVHHRGTKANLVVIEVKKSSNKSRIARLYDILKLHILLSDPTYNYIHGYFVDIPTGVRLDNLSEFRLSTNRFSPSMKMIEAQFS